MAISTRERCKQTLSALDLTRGAERLLYGLGYATISEFSLGSGRRIDLASVDARGNFSFIEVKSSAADFCSDHKWPEYLDYCDRFYFCVSASFPLTLLERPESQPEICGLIIADRFGGDIIRTATNRPLPASRRRGQLIRFAHRACERLFQMREA